MSTMVKTKFGTTSVLVDVGSFERAAAETKGPLIISSLLQYNFLDKMWHLSAVTQAKVPGTFYHDVDWDMLKRRLEQEMKDRYT